MFTFCNLFTKVYFCAAHISLSWKYFPLSHFFGGKVTAAARSFWIIFGRVATATENAWSGLHFCVGLCFPVPPVAIIRPLLFSSRVVPETIKHIHEWNPSLAISVPFSRPAARPDARQPRTPPRSQERGLPPSFNALYHTPSIHSRPLVIKSKVGREWWKSEVGVGRSSYVTSHMHALPHARMHAT